MNLKKWNVQRAKQHKLGKVLCLLLGDDKGAVAMEYVVIALLVAAAVVGLVMVFGGTIADMFATTGVTLTGEKGVVKAADMRKGQIEATDAKISTARTTGNTIRGQEEYEIGGDGGEATGTTEGK